MVIQVQVSNRRKYAPPETVCNVVQELRRIADGTDANRNARQSDKNNRHRERRRQAEEQEKAPVENVANGDGHLVCAKAQAWEEAMRDGRSYDEADASRAPHRPDSDRSAFENAVTKETEQDLTRTAAAGPTYVDQSQAEDQRDGAHIAQPGGVFAPRPQDAVFREALARDAGTLGAEAFGNAEPPNAKMRKTE